MFDFLFPRNSAPTEFDVFEPIAVPTGGVPELSEFDSVKETDGISAAIHDPTKQIVIAHGEERPYQSWLNDVAKDKRFPFEWHPDFGEFAEVFPRFLVDNCGIPLCDEMEQWSGDISSLGEDFAQFTGASQIAIRVHAMIPTRRSDQLPFHTDSDLQFEDLPLPKFKLVRVEVGDALEWVAEDNLKDDARMHAAHGGGTAEQILLRPDEIFRGPSHASALIRLGDDGLIHRTPRAKNRRIRVQIDSVA